MGTQGNLRVTWEHRRRYKLQSLKVQQKMANFFLSKRNKRKGAKYKFKTQKKY